MFRPDMHVVPPGSALLQDGTVVVAERAAHGRAAAAEHGAEHGAEHTESGPCWGDRAGTGAPAPAHAQSLEHDGTDGTDLEAGLGLAATDRSTSGESDNHS